MGEVLGEKCGVACGATQRLGASGSLMGEDETRRLGDQSGGDPEMGGLSGSEGRACWGPSRVTCRRWGGNRSSSSTR